MTVIYEDTEERAGDASVEVQQEISFTTKGSGIEINNLSILGGWLDRDQRWLGRGRK